MPYAKLYSCVILVDKLISLKLDGFFFLYKEAQEFTLSVVIYICIYLQLSLAFQHKIQDKITLKHFAE